MCLKQVSIWVSSSFCFLEVEGYVRGRNPLSRTLLDQKGGKELLLLPCVRVENLEQQIHSSAAVPVGTVAFNLKREFSLSSLECVSRSVSIFHPLFSPVQVSLPQVLAHHLQPRHSCLKVPNFSRQMMENEEHFEWRVLTRFNIVTLSLLRFWLRLRHRTTRFTWRFRWQFHSQFFFKLSPLSPQLRERIPEHFVGVTREPSVKSCDRHFSSFPRTVWQSLLFHSAPTLLIINKSGVSYPRSLFYFWDINTNREEEESLQFRRYHPEDGSERKANGSWYKWSE